MEEPEYILDNGTKVHTSKVLSSTSGITVKQHHLDARKPDTPGIIRGWVAGHGGDIYWVQHEDESVAAYGWMEFELVPGRTRGERLRESSVSSL